MKIVKHFDYDISLLDFISPQGFNNKKSMQYIKFPVYDGDKSPCIQLPNIELDMYGIPSKCDFYKEDSQRMFLKLPLNQNISDVKEITEFFNSIDNRFQSFHKNLPVPNPSKYTYQTLVRIPKNDDGTTNISKHPYLKLKLLTRFPTNEIETQIIERKDGINTLKANTETLINFEKYLQLKTKVKCLISPIKLWWSPPSSNEKMYGITFKLIKCMVQLSVPKLLTDSTLKNGDNFLDDNED
jgi:hypothetical protein